MTVYTKYIYSYFITNKKSGFKRLCEGIGQTLREDDSRDSTLAIYTMSNLIMPSPLTTCVRNSPSLPQTSEQVWTEAEGNPDSG